MNVMMDMHDYNKAEKGIRHTFAREVIEALEKQKRSLGVIEVVLWSAIKQEIYRLAGLEPEA